MSITSKYIDPFTDFGFKHIFGTEENKHLLMSFLNDILDIDDKIMTVEYRNLEKMGLNIIDRRAIFDIYCTDTKGNSFIVELQRSKQRYFKDRALYYTTFPIQEQSKRGSWDYELKKVFFIGILDFIMDDSNEDYLTKVKLINTKSKEVFYDKLTYYYIEMPKFKKEEKELLNHLEYWLFYLNNLTDFTQIPSTFKEDPYLTQAFEVAEFLALDKDQKFSYQQDLKTKWDYKAVMDYAKEEAKEEGRFEGFEKGIEKGLERGLEKGLERGLYEGIERGKAEGEKKKAIEIAKISLAKGLDSETISLITGLSQDEIDTLN
jgi:predicted transposase/invertase (TIGR01784 family)